MKDIQFFHIGLCYSSTLRSVQSNSFNVAAVELQLGFEALLVQSLAKATHAFPNHAIMFLVVPLSVLIKPQRWLWFVMIGASDVGLMHMTSCTDAAGQDVQYFSLPSKLENDVTACVCVWISFSVSKISKLSGFNP